MRNSALQNKDTAMTLF